PYSSTIELMNIIGISAKWLRSFVGIRKHEKSQHPENDKYVVFLNLMVRVQEGWCDSVGSVEEIQAKLLRRQEAAAKRERAMAYAVTHQVASNGNITMQRTSGLWSKSLIF
ncbi:hypothetical protein B296_00016813, partial [Ensete ventricosum]